MVHTQVIVKAYSKPLNKTSRRIAKKRNNRLIKAVGTQLLEHENGNIDALDAMRRVTAKTKPHVTEPHFDDVVAAANSESEVLQAFARVPQSNRNQELTRAIDARYKRLEKDMGFATSGLRRMVCLGALCMSAVGLTLAVSGLHLGALSLACGASVLALFIIMALATYGYRCITYRYTEKGRVDLAQHKAVLKALRKLCDQQNIMPDNACRKTLDRSLSVIQGDVGFVVLEVLRGTILEPAVSAIDTARRKLASWQLRRKAAALLAI